MNTLVNKEVDFKTSYETLPSIGRMIKVLSFLKCFIINVYGRITFGIPLKFNILDLAMKPLN